MKARKIKPGDGQATGPDRTVHPLQSGKVPVQSHAPNDNAGHLPTPALSPEQIQRIIDAGHAAAQCDDPDAAPAQRAIELLTRLVATPSLSTREAAAASLLVAWFAEHGLESRIDEVGNSVGTFQAPGESDRPVHILLLGHIDTVPGAIPPRLEHRTLFGRGAVDAKGSLAAFACAASRLAADPSALPAGCRITVVGAVEEESATSRGARHVAAQFAKLPPQACIIGEPSGADGVTLGYKGRLLVRARFERDSAHSAGPDSTAAEVATEFFLACRAIGDRHDARLVGQSGPFHRLQITLRSITSSDDGLRQTAECVLSFRLPPGGPPPEDLEARVRTLAADLPFNAPGTRLSLAFEGHEHACQSPRSDAAARHLAGAIRRVFGRAPRIKLKTGTSDMNVVAPAFGCPIVAYGPGDSSLDHSPNERIDLDREFLPAIDVLVQAIPTLARELADTTGESNSV